MGRNLPLPSEISNPIVLADWLELLALISEDGNASHGDLQRVLNRLGIEDSDALCRDSMSELNRRVLAAGEKYPFDFSGSLVSVKGKWTKYSPYVFCLLLSYCDDKQKKIKGFQHELMFEQLSCIAAKTYLDGEVLRFGSPRSDLPKAFRDALRFLCTQVNEWNYFQGTDTLHRRDGGLDLVAWKHFPDRQLGKLILFGHCASGQNWDEKITELQPADFCSQWLGGEKSPIVKTFFIPHRVPPDAWEFRAISAKLLFDRCRIACWADSNEFCSVTKQASLRWCEKVLKKVAR